MPQSLSNLLVHLVFSTKNREPWLTETISGELYPYLVGVLNNMDCPSLQVGGHTDHLHLLFRMARTETVAKIVEILKVSSSKWIKTRIKIALIFIGNPVTEHFQLANPRRIKSSPISATNRNITTVFRFRKNPKIFGTASDTI